MPRVRHLNADAPCVVCEIARKTSLMQCPDLTELPAARATPATDSRTSRWELDAALAVLERAREEWLASTRGAEKPSPQLCEVLRRRLQSAHQLVTRIQNKLQAAES